MKNRNVLYWMIRRMPLAALMVVCLGLFACEMEPESKQVPALDRRSEGTWYQIFSFSFFDSNGDGIGDLNGIAQKLDYLNDSHTKSHKSYIDKGQNCPNSLHIDGIWLTPIMPSPSYHKYDTKDYVDIDPAFGSLADFQYLLRECHEHDIKLIIDLVLNHSSEQHPWFQKALAEVRAGRPGRYASYYHFYYGATPPENYKFKWDEHGNSYYKWWGKATDSAWFEGSFWTGMPDLNWDSQALREELEEIVTFWLKQGLDGFRLDATSWPYNYRGMERVPGLVNGDDKNIALWTWFTQICQKVNPDVFLIGECWEGTDTIANYYDSGMNFFGFQFSFGGGAMIPNAAINGAGQNYATHLAWWDKAIKTRNSRAVSAPFISNHDQPRSYGLLGNYADNSKMAASLLLFAPGAPFIYYGEEIGMTSPGWEESPDSNRRGPMVWSWPRSNGMTDPPPEWTWGEQAPKSGQGVAQQIRDPGSILAHYIKLGNMKKRYPWLAYGKIESLGNVVTDTEIAAYRLINPDNPDQSVIVMHNTNYNNEKTVTFTYGGTGLFDKVKYVESVMVHGWNQTSWPDGTTWDPIKERNKLSFTTIAGFDLPPYSTTIFQDYSCRTLAQAYLPADHRPPEEVPGQTAGAGPQE